ncbi:MAG: alpha/beta fold hydrolase [Candidatus Omnitrophica bacterium]|nr:alpha/beta fold hydrolase [Candidatus Omnitrophota bacterium]
MAVQFSLNLRFSKKRQDQGHLPDNGLELPGKNGDAVILIHGMTGTPHEMRFLANYLNRQGYAVFCPRLANHGAPLHVLQKSKWEDFYQSVRACYLKIRHQYKHVYTGGLSMGALLALLLADEFKDGIQGVSCLSPTLFYDGWNAPWYRLFLPLAYNTPLKYFAYFKEESPYGIKNEAVRRKVHEFYCKAQLHNMEQVHQYGYPFFPVTLLYQLQRLVKHLKCRLHGIKAPVQLIQAQHDDMSSVRNSKFIYERVKSDRKELVLLHNSYHIITADQERSIVAQHIQRFLSGQPQLV